MQGIATYCLDYYYIYDIEKATFVVIERPYIIKTVRRFGDQVFFITDAPSRFRTVKRSERAHFDQIRRIFNWNCNQRKTIVVNRIESDNINIPELNL